VNTSAPVTHAQLGELLAARQFGIGPSDLHGSLTGYLCGGGVADSRHWLAALELDPVDRAAETPDVLLTQLYEQCAAWFEDPELGFEPLLPPDDASLERRADALVEWCRGFLGGLGLAGVSQQHGLSPDGAEILRDFGTIAGTHFEYADTEEDENALTEVIEFIRVGVLLLHAEIVSAPKISATLH
jgi:yecA family protein